MKQELWIALFAAAGLGITSCSDNSYEAPETPGSGPSQIVATSYLGFQLKDAEMNSRSTHLEYDDEYERFEWFNKGTADERAIISNPDCNRVLFFNADYSYYGSGKLERPDIAGVAPNVYVAAKPEVIGEMLPAYALVVLNADPERMDALDTDLMAAGTDAVKNVLNYINKVDTSNPESVAQYEGYFTMSSTVYRDADSNALIALTPLNTAGPVFYETVEEAILPEHLTTFYVERLLAKFTLIIKDGNRQFNTSEPIIVDGANKIKVRVQYAPAGGEVKDIMTDWKVNLVNWGMNGLEKNTFLVKTLAENPGAYPWNVENNFYIGWNSPALYRSFWGIDENYSSGIYPDQYRQALDVEGVKAATVNNIYSANYSSETGLEKGDYTLIYKPYSAYSDRTANKYSLENTFDASILSDQDLSSYPWLRCGTHILLTAQFIINEIDTDIDLSQVDENGFIPGVADKYQSNGLYWSEEALLEQAVATLKSNIYYNKKGYEIPDVINGGFIEFLNSEEKPIDDFPFALDDGTPQGKVILEGENFKEDVKKYFKFDKAFIKGGDGWVTLKLQDNVPLKIRYIDRNTNTVSLGDISEAQLVSYIYRFTNLAKHYKEGRMYYAIAIRHNLNSPNFESNSLTKVSTGDFGVVRNTWYRMTINDILSPGTPVDDPDQPIIPNPEPDEKSLGVEVEVIPWETVDINVGQLH